MKPYDKAYNLFFNSNLTQQQIAEQAGVSPRTIYEWMKNGNWKTLKATSRLMPAQIVDDLYNHISHLNYKIKSRDFEERYPSKEEAETLRKLISSIPKVKLNVSKGESAQSMMNFVSWLQHHNNDAAIYVAQYVDDYLHADRKQGMDPYEFEYDADQYYNPADFPNRNTVTFHEQTMTQYASLRGTARPDDISGKQSHDDTEAEPGAQQDAPSLFLGKACPEHRDNNSLSFGEGRGEAPLVPEKQEPHQQKTGTKSEALSTSPNTPKPLENQNTKLNISTQTTSETKDQKIGSAESSPQPNVIDLDIQAVFNSWKKLAEKGRRKRRY